MERLVRGGVRAVCFASLGGVVGYLFSVLFGSVLGRILGQGTGAPDDVAVIGIALGALTAALMSEPAADEGPSSTLSMNEGLRARLTAESFGTFALVFAGTGAVIVNDLTGAVSPVGVALTFGLAVLALVHALGGVSAVHLNPAVTLGFFLARRFPARRVVPYAVSQFAGAVVASALLQLLFPGASTLGATRPAGPIGQSFCVETALALVLMFVVLSGASRAREWGAAAAVGAVVTAAVLFAGPVSGASMNPARSLAPALVAGKFDALWVYLAAPPFGAGLAVLVCRCVHGRPCCGVPAEQAHA